MKSLNISHFRMGVLLFAMWLVVDQLIMWPWSLQGTFVPVSFLSFLPQAFWESKTACYVFSAISWIATVLWLLRVFPKVTSIIAALTFAFTVTFYLQNLTFGDHRQGVVMLLMMFLIAVEFGYLERVFFILSGIVLASLYFLSGVEKLIFSGFAWANGTSLQIFVYYLGKEGSLLRDFILHHVEFAKASQWFMLIIELGVFLIFVPRVRWVILLGLLAFHIGIEEIFFYRFFPLYILVFYIFGWSDVKGWLHARKN